MMKIRTQIQHTLRNSKLSDTVKLDIVERANEKFCKLKESMRPTKTTNVAEAGPAPARIVLVPTEPPMFQSVKVPANRSRRFKMFLMFLEDNPDLIGKNEQNAMVVEEKPLEGANFHDLNRNNIFQQSKYNVTGLSEFSQALSKAKLSPSAISSSKHKERYRDLSKDSMSVLEHGE